MEVTAAVAVVLSVLGGIVSAYAALRQRKTEEAAIVVGAMRDHMRMLTDENAELRQRARASEEKIYEQNNVISDLRVHVAHCDADKNRLRTELDELKRKVGRITGEDR